MATAASCKLLIVVLATFAASHVQSRTVTITSGPGLAAGFAAPDVDTLVVAADLALLESDWDGIAVPILRTSNLTILSNASVEDPSTWPLIDWGFVSEKVRMANQTALTVRTVVQRNIRRADPALAVGNDLFLSCLPGETALMLMSSTAFVFDFCYPPIKAGSPLAFYQRPSAVPGAQQFKLTVPQFDCINVTAPTPAAAGDGVPWMRRCWPRRGAYDDVAMLGTDINATTGQLSVSGYVMHMVSTIYVCNQILSDSCIAALGHSGCYSAMQQGTWAQPQQARSPPVQASQTSPPLAPPSQRTSSDMKSSSGGGGSSSNADDKTGAIVGGAIGGAVLCGAVIAGVGILIRRKRRRRYLSPTSGTSQGVLSGSNGKTPDVKTDASTCGVTVAAAPTQNGTVDSGQPASDAPLEGSAPHESSMLMVSPLTALRPDVKVAAEAVTDEVKLLTRVLGKGSFGKVVEGEYRGQKVAVKILTDMSLAAWGLPAANPAAPIAASTVLARGLEASPAGLAAAGDDRGEGARAIANANATDAGGGGVPDVTSSEAMTALVAAQPTACGDDNNTSVRAEGPFPADGTNGKVLDADAKGTKFLDPTTTAAAAAATAANKAHTAGRGGGVGGGGGRDDGIGGGGISPDTFQSIIQEVEVLGRCCHPNVVRLLAACLTPPRVCLVLELMETSLEHLLADYAAAGALLPFNMALDIALDVAQGLAYLHPTILHRDLKPGNVLVNVSAGPRAVAKVSDFGLSRLCVSTMMTNNPEAGTAQYMAPELFHPNNIKVSHKCDIYSFGVLLWAMLSGQQPWQGLNMVEIACSLVVAESRLPLEAIPAGRKPSRLLRLIWDCWDQDPRRRPAADDVAKQLMLAVQGHGGEQQQRQGQAG